MADKILDDLGRFLVQNVRDKGIRHWDKVIDGSMRGRTAEQVREVLRASPGSSPAVAAVVPMIIDQALHDLLASLQDTDQVQLAVRSDGQTVNPKELSDGLAGELYGGAGWISRFSEGSNSH